MSFGELLFLGLLALLVFGPRQLPEIARNVARFITELRRASNEFRYTLEDEFRQIEMNEQAQKRLEAPVVEPEPVAGTVARTEPPGASPEEAEIASLAEAASTHAGAPEPPPPQQMPPPPTH